MKRHFVKWTGTFIYIMKRHFYFMKLKRHCIRPGKSSVSLYPRYKQEIWSWSKFCSKIPCFCRKFDKFLLQKYNLSVCMRFSKEIIVSAQIKLIKVFCKTRTRHISAGTMTWLEKMFYYLGTWINVKIFLSHVVFKTA